ncbi:MAG: substrate-binding domain-containing protein [Pseudomonadota bacterium]
MARRAAFPSLLALASLLTPAGRRLIGAAALAVVPAAAVPTAPALAADTSDLVSKSSFRVCADPANLPFSSRDETGFENEIAELLAAKLELPVTYEWFPQAIGFVRRTLMAGKCDVIMGYAQGHELVLNTNHYYVSSYVLATRADGPLADVDALADPALKGRKIGVVAGSPPATHMATHGLIGDARPYRLMVDRRIDSPSEQMIADLEAGEIDAALMWGPIGGYFAGRSATPLKVTPLLKEEGPPRMFYRVTLGVRQGEVTWKRKLNSLLRRNQAEIDVILAKYNVPAVDEFGRAGTE